MKKTLLAIPLIYCLSLMSFSSRDSVVSDNTMSNDWTFLSTATAWYSATESAVIYIYYKYGNGEWTYGYSTERGRKPGMWNSVSANRLYASKDCSDFRRNYKYMAGTSFFNCRDELHMPKTVNGWTFYSTATAWHSATSSQIIYIYYKRGNGVTEYGYASENGDTPGMWDVVSRNELYQSSDCNSFERNYRYTAGCCLYFNLKRK